MSDDTFDALVREAVAVMGPEGETRLADAASLFQLKDESAAGGSEYRRNFVDLERAMGADFVARFLVHLSSELEKVNAGLAAAEQKPEKPPR
jgi:hypothetical protein